jgi:hypothetical protein
MPARLFCDLVQRLHLGWAQFYLLDEGILEESLFCRICHDLQLLLLGYEDCENLAIAGGPPPLAPGARPRARGGEGCDFRAQQMASMRTEGAGAGGQGEACGEGYQPDTGFRIF